MTLTKQKLFILILSTILGLFLVAGCITAGVLLRQSTPPADAVTENVYIYADGTTATSSDYDWALEIYYSSSTATTCRLDGVTRRSGSTATTIVIPSSVTIDGTSRNLTSMYSSSSSSGSVFYSVRSYITEVTLPETLTSLGAYTFSGCSNLVQVNMSEKIIVPLCKSNACM